MFSSSLKLNRREECLGYAEYWRVNLDSVLIKNLHNGWFRISLGGGGRELRGGYGSKILYVETKESGPLGGRASGTPL